jgi:hypothetical protein
LRHLPASPERRPRNGGDRNTAFPRQSIISKDVSFFKLMSTMASEGSCSNCSTLSVRAVCDRTNNRQPYLFKQSLERVRNSRGILHDEHD